MFHLAFRIEIEEGCIYDLIAYVICMYVCVYVTFPGEDGISPMFYPIWYSIYSRILIYIYITNIIYIYIYKTDSTIDACYLSPWPEPAWQPVDTQETTLTKLCGWSWLHTCKLPTWNDFCARVDGKNNSIYLVMFLMRRLTVSHFDDTANKHNMPVIIILQSIDRRCPTKKLADCGNSCQWECGSTPFEPYLVI